MIRKLTDRITVQKMELGEGRWILFTGEAPVGVVKRYYLDRNQYEAGIFDRVFLLPEDMEALARFCRELEEEGPWPPQREAQKNPKLEVCPLPQTTEGEGSDD
jgi:hypothetical protein